MEVLEDLMHLMGERVDLLNEGSSDRLSIGGVNDKLSLGPVESR
jgi:thymidine phosphorylase